MLLVQTIDIEFVCVFSQQSHGLYRKSFAAASLVSREEEAVHQAHQQSSNIIEAFAWSVVNLQPSRVVCEWVCWHEPRERFEYK